MYILHKIRYRFLVKYTFCFFQCLEVYIQYNVIWSKSIYFVSKAEVCGHYSQKMGKIIWYEAEKRHNEQIIFLKARKRQKHQQKQKSDSSYICIQHIFPWRRKMVSTILTYPCASYYNWISKEIYCQSIHRKKA